MPGNPVEYYRDAHVQARMREDVTGSMAAPVRAAFLAGIGPSDGPCPSWESALPVPASDIEQLWTAGADIARSLWDEENLIFVIDIDYQNVDDPAEPFLRRADVFVKLEPVYRAVRRVLGEHDIHPTPMMTGRGYRLSGRIPLGAPVIDTLANLVPGLPAWFESLDDRREACVTARMTARQASAWAGLGLVTEYLAGRVIREAQPESRIPVVVNGTVVGRGAIGRECTSLDFSHFGNPLDVRHLRVAVQHLPVAPAETRHLRLHGSRPSAPRRHAPNAIGPAPHARTRTALGRGLAAARTPTPSPDVSAGLASLVSSYEASPLRTFHREFFDDTRTTDSSVRALDTTSLPPCLAMTLARPNDLLLKPAHIQHMVRGLTARGWPAGDIARLVRAKYDEDHAWGRRWRWMHSRTRAEFDVRVYAGLLSTGLDSLVDFNCVSAQEKDLCPGLPCRHDLRDDREMDLANGDGSPPEPAPLTPCFQLASPPGFRCTTGCSTRFLWCIKPVRAVLKSARIRDTSTRIRRAGRRGGEPSGLARRPSHLDSRAVWSRVRPGLAESGRAPGRHRRGHGGGGRPGPVRRPDRGRPPKRPRAAPPDPANHLGNAVASLSALAVRVGELGLSLAVETPLPHLIGGHPDEFRWILDRLDGRVGVCLDTGHAALGHNWHRLLDLTTERLLHVHASDNHGTRDDHKPPGDGQIDWAEIARTLAAVHFGGWIMLELHGPDEEPARYLSRALSQAHALIRPIHPRVG